MLFSPIVLVLGALSAAKPVDYKSALQRKISHSHSSLKEKLGSGLHGLAATVHRAYAGTDAKRKLEGHDGHDGHDHDDDHASGDDGDDEWDLVLGLCPAGEAQFVSVLTDDPEAGLSRAG